MSFENDLELLIDIERLIRKLGQHGWKRIEALIDGCRPHPQIIHGRFDGPYTTTKEGKIIMATFQITVGAPFTGKLIFTGSDGSNPAGPVGVLTVDDANTVVSLSADGQAYNIQSNVAPTTGTVINVTWTDPANVVPSFNAQFTDQPVPVTVTGAFDTPVPGTTA